MKFKISRNVKGIVGVSFTNIISLIISMLISFVLPLFLSVEGYGYWQLYVLYSGYAGVFALGFNDGIHLNYAGRDYEQSLWEEESAYIRFLFILSFIETIIVNIVLLSFRMDSSTKYWVLVLTSLNIIPTIICGMISYINQSAMRYRQYAIGHIVERVAFVVFMILLILLKIKNPLVFIGSYTVSKYITIIYHFVTSKEAFKTKPVPLSSLKPQIRDNFTSGLILMVATTLNTSIIIFSRLLVEHHFGISEFSAYSFALHTLTVASQFIVAITAVFYPILKRCDEERFHIAYKSFDASSSLLSIVLLLTYYGASILISLVYKKYNSVLEYLYVVYPLFIFQCKSNLLVINTYKVKKQPLRMLIMNAIGICINALLTLIAYYLTKSIPVIAVATLAGFIIWYYFCQYDVHKQNKWQFGFSELIDLVATIVFIAINYCLTKLNVGIIKREFIGLGICICLVLITGIMFRKGIKGAIRDTLKILDR